MFYSLKEDIQWAGKILKKGSFRSLYKAMNFDRPPILIGGCGRSGTSVLQSIISAHPNICTIKYETSVFSEKRKFKSNYLNKVNQIRKILAHILIDRDPKLGVRWVEKTPRNIRYFDKLLAEFNGEVKLVQIVRDGRAVVSSKLPGKEEYHVPIYRWINDVSYGIEMDKLPGVYTLRYEDLVSNFEDTVDDLFVFLEEDICNEVYNFHEHTSVKKHGAFHGKDVKPIFSSSIENWKKEENQAIVSELLTNEKAIELLKYYNYL